MLAAGGAGQSRHLTTTENTMSMERGEVTRLAREALAKANPESHCADPKRYEPPEWLVEAMQAAFASGVATGRRLERREHI